jgi:multicomponent Na+:H+ antiporter subunit E
MAAAWRGPLYLGLWLVIAGGDPAGLVFGMPAALAATWVSLRLLPPADRALRPLAMLRLALGILRSSVAAGLDIALRALDPRLPIRPGLVTVPLRLPPGPARDGFRLVASLQPGTLPAGLDAGDRLVLHALDTSLEVAREAVATEAQFVEAAGGARAHG